MRLVQTEDLKESDIIARDIVDYSGGVLLRHHTRFKEVYKAKLLERSVFEVYIEDELSKEIEPKEILSSAVRHKINGDIRNQFDKLKDSMSLDIDTMTEVASLLIDELQGKDMVLELQDLRSNDNYTYEHCLSVAILTDIVCNKLGILTEMKKQIVMGALIHDIGKIIIPKDVLNKPGRLTSEEYELIKTHVEIGYKMIKDNTSISAITKLSVLCHHEREDGSGYPLKKGKELHISAKIVAACDLVHALISDRCYRQGLPINEVITILDAQPINPKIRDIIKSTLCYYPVGSVVVLNDGRLGLVEKNHAEDIKKPTVRIIDKVNGKYECSYKVNLLQEGKTYIVNRHEGRIC